MIMVCMQHAKTAQELGAGTYAKIGKEGANVEKHAAQLFGILRGIHDNQVMILTALAALMAQQHNRIVTPPSGIAVPDFARRGKTKVGKLTL